MTDTPRPPLFPPKAYRCTADGCTAPAVIWIETLGRHYCARHNPENDA